MYGSYHQESRSVLRSRDFGFVTPTETAALLRDRALRPGPLRPDGSAPQGVFLPRASYCLLKRRGRAGTSGSRCRVGVSSPAVSNLSLSCQDEARSLPFGRKVASRSQGSDFPDPEPPDQLPLTTRTHPPVAWNLRWVPFSSPLFSRGAGFFPGILQIPHIPLKPQRWQRTLANSGGGQSALAW